ncbi:MAG: phospholipase D-like domain-containing protein [Ignisphaera sp.]
MLDRSGYERGYERRGLEALYTFTPFKIVYKQHGGGAGEEPSDAYTLVILPPTRFKAFYYKDFGDVCRKNLIDLLKREYPKKNVWGFWFRSTLRKLPISVDNRYNVYEYVDWPAFQFKKDGPYVVVLHSILYRALTEDIPIEYRRLRNLFNKHSGLFLLAEYSYESLAHPRFCLRGLVLISHRDSCPIKYVCPFAIWGRCSGNLYSIRETYSGLYKVIPQIKVKLLDLETVEGDRKRSRVRLFVIPFGFHPLAYVYFVDELSLLAFYEGVVFQPKKCWIPYHFASFRYTLGIRILNTDAIVLEFETSTLDKIVNDLMEHKWVVYKKVLLSESKLCDDSKCDMKPDYLAPWKRLYSTIQSNNAETFDTLVRDSKSLDEANKQYYRFIVVHTIAHNIISSLWSELGLDQDYLSYRVLYDGGKWKIYLYETVSGGLGYLKYLAMQKSRLYEIIVKSIYNESLIGSRIVEEYCRGGIDDRDVAELKRFLENVAKYAQGDRELADTANELSRFISLLYEVYRRHGVTIHPYTIRYILQTLVPGRLRETFGNTMDRIVSMFSAFDGNIGCGFIEDGCSLGPFLEPLSISYTVVEYLAKQHSRAGEGLSLGTSVRDIILPWLKMARTKLRIITSNISIDNNIIGILSELCRNGGSVFVMLSKNAVDDEVSRTAVNELRNSLGGCIKVRISENLRAKAIIIDDMAVIEDPFDFAKSGLVFNIENLSKIITDPAKVGEYVRKFNELWNSSKEYDVM